jgi:hypothetical protein
MIVTLKIKLFLFKTPYGMLPFGGLSFFLTSLYLLQFQAALSIINSERPKASSY